MEISKPAPETEDIIEFEFVFAGNIPAYYCVVPAKGETVRRTGTAVVFTRGTEVRTVYLSQVLCEAESRRTRTLPDKELKPKASTTP